MDRVVATSARAFQKPTASAKEFRSDTQIPAGTGGAKVLPTAPSVTPRALTQAAVVRASWERAHWCSSACCRMPGPCAFHVRKSSTAPTPARARRRPLLRGVELALDLGEVAGLARENGSGKSTLLMILVGALTPNAGSVTVAGRLGYCPQEPQVYARLTCDEHFELFGHYVDGWIMWPAGVFPLAGALRGPVPVT